MEGKIKTTFSVFGTFSLKIFIQYKYIQLYTFDPTWAFTQGYTLCQVCSESVPFSYQDDLYNERLGTNFDVQSVLEPFAQVN